MHISLSSHYQKYWHIWKAISRKVNINEIDLRLLFLFFVVFLDFSLLFFDFVVSTFLIPRQNSNKCRKRPTTFLVPRQTPRPEQPSGRRSWQAMVKRGWSLPLPPQPRTIRAPVNVGLHRNYNKMKKYGARGPIKSRNHEKSKNTFNLAWSRKTSKKYNLFK